MRRDVNRYDTLVATGDRQLLLHRLLALERWLVGDARYWRALNESELERNEEAWVSIEAAAKLLINAQVPKLAGLIAYRRQQLDVARAKFGQELKSRTAVA